MAPQSVLGRVASFASNAMGGVRGRQNAAAWVVAGAAAYFLWIKPERDALRDAAEERALRQEKQKGSAQDV